MVHNLQDPAGSYRPVTSVTETNGGLYGLMAQTIIVIGRGRFLADPRTATSGSSTKPELVPTIGVSSVSRSD
jgi:hypothetical protein